MVKVVEALPIQNARVLEERKAKANDPRNEVYLSIKLKALKDTALSLIEEVSALETFESCDAQNSIDLQHGIDFNEEVIRFETYLILLALERTGGNQKRAAQLLGLKQTTLNSKIQRYKISSRTSHSTAHTLSAVKR